MSATEAKKGTEIKPEIIALSKIIEKEVSIDAKSGAATVAPDTYAKTLPEGLTVEGRKAYSDHDTAFAAAAAHVVGNAGVDAFKKTKGLDRVTAEFDLSGKDKFTVTVDRSKTSHNPQDPGKEIVKYGVISGSLEQRAGRNSGQFKAVRTAVADRAAELIAGK